ncbi:ATP-grasp domain-containing protein [Streptomyces sp. NPDC001393]
MARHVVFVTWKTGNAPAFEAAKRLGHRVTLIRSRQMEKYQNIDFNETDHGKFVDAVHLLDDATEFEALRACVLDIHAEYAIDGFLATVDALVVPVARIAEELGIPFTSAHGAATAKQKDACRAALAAAGVDTTEHAAVEGLDGALGFAAAHGYPLVVKPACGSASEGAHVVPDEQRLRELFAELDGSERQRAAYRHGMLVERYLTGRFVSAEIGLSHGRFLRFAVSERKTWDQHKPLELGTTIPAAISEADRQVVMEFAERALTALDMRLGVFHVEVMLGEDGVARLIELNPRVMGSCLPELFVMAGGGDLFELLVRIYLDEEIPAQDPAFSAYATVRWFGAAQRQPKPETVPDLSWAAEYGTALRSLWVRFPRTELLEPCRGNVGNFGEVQVVHADHATSIRIAEEIVERVEAQLGFEVTR